MMVTVVTAWEIRYAYFCTRGFNNQSEAFEYSC